jgi:hypothetical protein
MQAVIDNVTYPLLDWRIVRQGEMLKEEWLDGFTEGMGQYLLRRGQTYYVGKNIDTGTYPYIRLRPYFVASTATANLTGAAPMYAFQAQDGSANNYYFVLNLGRMFKYDASDYSLLSTKDLTAGAAGATGRPAHFEGKWYIPLGGVNAVELTTIAVGAAAETYTDLAVKAEAFAVTQKRGIAQLARAHTVNQVDLASAISTPPVAGDWSGDNWEVGESGIAIADLLAWRGEVAVVKQDAVYLFGPADGESYALHQLPGRNLNMELIEGSNSDVEGQLLFWTTSPALWRFLGNRGTPIGPEADQRWLKVTLDSFTPLSGTDPANRRSSVVTWVRWIYYARSTQLYYGYIRDDGTVRWHGCLFDNGGSGIRIQIVGGGGGLGAILLIADTSAETMHFMPLNLDGSPDTALGSKRGKASEAAQFWLPNLDFGRPGVQKQLRRCWAIVEDGGANQPIEFRVHRDRATASEQVGTDVTASGYVERAWTPGTDDLAYEVQPSIKFDLQAGYTPASSDPRIHMFGIQAATPSMYAAEILVTVDGLDTGQSVSTVLQALRDLVGGTAITIKEPKQGGPEDSFSAHITAIGEVAFDRASQREQGYRVTVYFERFDYGA